ncbi:MAG: DUF177 domain-containing protein [Firmicutes bacterium]|nr:DUF177 domain-containing protein [Bacillota bacterium]
MKVDISDIVGVKAASLDFDLSVERLPLVFPFAVSGFVDPVKVKGRVTNTGKYFLVQGKIETRLAVECGRCLQPFEYPVELEFEAEFQKAKSKQGDVARESQDRQFNEEGSVYTYEGNTLDLTKVVEDELTVGLPMKMLCREDCKGLCSSCGQNLNEGQCDCVDDSIDPRMEVLRSLLDNTEQKAKKD